MLPLLLLAVGCASSGAGEGAEVAASVATPTPATTATPPATSTPLPTATPAPTATSTPVPTATLTPAPSCVERLPDRVALAQLLLPLADPGQFPGVADGAAAGEISGFVLLGAPSLDELEELPRVDAAGVPLLWASDEEGGSVQRLDHLLGPLPTAASLPGTDPAAVTTQYDSYGAAMADLGFSVAFAPVVDVGAGPGIDSRSVSDDPAVVTEYAAAVIAGYQTGGVTPGIKHFPGHGRGSADSHLAFSTTPPLDELRTRDLVPFVDLVDTGALVMVGHLLVPGLTEDVPTSLSPEAIDGLLRTGLGYDGVVVTDALGMAAVSQRWTNAEAAELALVAGADLVILDDPTVAAPVLDYLEASLAVGTLTRDHVDDSVERVLALKATDPCSLQAPPAS